jgi:O-glycosyl hydrolase
VLAGSFSVHRTQLAKNPALQKGSLAFALFARLCGNSNMRPHLFPGCSWSVSGFRGLTLWFALSVLTAFGTETKIARLETNSGAPEFDGWGTSLCWFANAIGRWPEPQRSEIADALFSKAGLGLTVVRYNIGGGENPEHHHMPWFRQMEGFQSAAGEWNWNADSGQRWMLEAAIKRGANRLEAFSNSPPYWMTLSHCASGAPNGNADNLNPQHEEAFANYLVHVVQHFRDTWNIRFDTLEPMNEPFTDYWHENGNQEGCHFERASQAKLIQQLRAELDKQGLHSLKISASDETNYDRAIGTWESFDEKTRACVAQINSHAYETARRTELRELAQRSGKPLVMSEVDGPGSKRHDHKSMEPALVLAGGIIDDLRDLRPLQWVFWQAVENEAGMAQSNINWGLIHADLEGTSHAWSFTKKYFALANFSKFIRPGARLLNTGQPNSVAAYDAKQSTLVIVVRNADSADESVTYDLSAFGKMEMSVKAYRTSAGEDLAELPAASATGGNLATLAKAQSITTYVASW